MYLFYSKEKKRYCYDFEMIEKGDSFVGIKDDLIKFPDINNYFPIYVIQNIIVKKTLSATQNDLDDILETIYKNICKVIDIFKNDANPSTTSKEEPKDGNFASYVSQNCTCPKCGKPMRLRKNYNKGTFFLSCSGYPSCQSTQEITIQLVDDYFHTWGEYGKRCDKCKFETYLSVKNGRYGIYIECGSGFHKYKFDQI